MNKTYRHGQILRIIRRQRIHTQEELGRELAVAGIDVSQVTLSRDLHELGLMKGADGYRDTPVRVAGPALESILPEFLQDVRVAQNLLVLRTSPGNANSLAVALDQAGWAEVVGTVAGDDTILVVAPDGGVAAALRVKLLALL